MTHGAAAFAQYALAFAKAGAFAATAPPLGSGFVPKAVRVVLALTLTPVLAGHYADAPVSDWTSVVPSALRSAIEGAVFGTAAAIVASAGVAAGGMVDATLASSAIGREAIFGGGSGTFGMLYSLALGWAFLATGALTHLCERFVAASPSLQPLASTHDAVALLRASTDAALNLAFPAIIAQLLGTIAAGVISRAAPRINGMMLASPIVTAIVLVSLLASAPVIVSHLVALAIRAASIAL